MSFPQLVTKIANVEITKELLCDILKFPKGTAITGVNDIGRDILIQVIHKDLEAIEEGQPYPIIHPVYERRIDGRTIFVRWN